MIGATCKLYPSLLMLLILSDLQNLVDELCAFQLIASYLVPELVDALDAQRALLHLELRYRLLNLVVVVHVDPNGLPPKPKHIALWIFVFFQVMVQVLFFNRLKVRDILEAVDVIL